MSFLNGRVTEKLVVPVKCCTEQGTAFFIGRKQLLTARHVVREYFNNPGAPEPIFIYFEGLALTCKAKELRGLADVAILTIIDDEPFEVSEWLILLKDRFIPKLELTVYGYPQEIAMGVNIVSLLVMNRLEISGWNDRALIRLDKLKLIHYDGLSGSPVVNREGRVIGILTLQVNETLSYLSVAKISELLASNGVIYAEDWQKEDNTTFGQGRSVDLCEKAVASIHDRYMPGLHQENKQLEFRLKSISDKKVIDEKTRDAKALVEFVEGIKRNTLKKIIMIFNHPESWMFDLTTRLGVENLELFCQYALKNRFDHILSWDDEIEFNRRVIKLRDGNAFDYINGGLTKNLCLIGKAGSGKTHNLCEFATKKQDLANIYLFFGTEFRVHESVTEHIRAVICEEKEFQDFNHEMQAKGRYAIVVIDALNEGLGCTYWNNQLGALRKELSKYDHIRLVVSVRSPFNQELSDLTSERSEWKTIEVEGFENVDTAKAKFFKEYGIPDEYKDKKIEAFSNPLFLKIFCETFHSMTHSEQTRFSKRIIYKKYVEKKNVAISHIVDEDIELNVADKYLMRLANYSVNYNHFNVISRQKAREYARRICPGRFWSNDLLNALLTSSLLLEDRSTGDGAAVMFEYENLGDYYKAEQLLEPKKEVNRVLEWLIENKRFFTRNPMIPSHKFENTIIALYECWKELGANVQKNEKLQKNEFLRELYISYLLNSDLEYNEVLNLMTELDPSIEQDLKLLRTPQELTLEDTLNIHSHLKSYETIAKRDLLWTNFVNGLFESYGGSIILTLIRDGNEPQNVDDSERAFLIRLGWLLTSSHPKYRALVVRHLRKELKAYPAAIVWLLDMFAFVNDPYILNGLFCAVAGVILPTRDIKLAGYVAEYIYKTYFERPETVPQDLIVRQWSLKIIEKAYSLDSDNIWWTLIKTPFEALPFDETVIPPVKEINPDYLGMQHGSRLMYNSIFGFEDFNRYIIGTNNRHKSNDYFKYDEIAGGYEGDDLEREEAEIAYYIKNVFGWNDKLGFLDNGKYSVNRSHNDMERIGKKFQWLAWYRLNARLMDTYRVSKSTYHYSDKAKEEELTVTPYPWNSTEVTYFDPTLDVEAYNHSAHLLHRIEMTDVVGAEDEEWISKNEYVPVFRYKSELEDGTPYVMLRGFDKAQQGQKETVVITNAAFVKQADAPGFEQWCKNQNFYGRWMPERNGMYEFLWNDYPWADAYKNSLEIDAWERPSNGCPCEIMLAYEAQLQEQWEGIAYEDEYLTTVYMPCSDMMEQSGMYCSDVRGIVKLKSDNSIVGINTSHENGMTGLFVRKDVLDEYLRKNDFVLFYYVLGEKVHRAESPNSVMKDLSAAYRYNLEGSVIELQIMRVIERELPKPIDATPEKIDALKKKNHEEGLTQRETLELITLERILKEKSKNVEPGEDD